MQAPASIFLSAAIEANTARGANEKAHGRAVATNQELMNRFNGVYDAGTRSFGNLHGLDEYTDDTGAKRKAGLVFLAPAEEFSAPEGRVTGSPGPRGRLLPKREAGDSGRPVPRQHHPQLVPGRPGVWPGPPRAVPKQRVGRALRTCSHQHLPEGEQSVRIDLFVAVHQNPYFPPTLDAEKLLIVERQMEDVERGMQSLRCLSIDARYYPRTLPPDREGPRPIHPWIPARRRGPWSLRVPDCTTPSVGVVPSRTLAGTTDCPRCRVCRSGPGGGPVEGQNAPPSRVR